MPGQKREKRDRDDRRPREEDKEELDERVVDITRVSKVVKGGRHFSFRTVVIVGDNHGRIGIGIGKSRAVPEAIRKGTEGARKKMLRVTLSGTTIPHAVTAKHGSAVVMLKPATPGTGVIAGGGVRAVLEAAGVHDILSKSQGSNNTLNVAMATLKALQMLKSANELAIMRGKEPGTVVPFWERRSHDNVSATVEAVAPIADVPAIAAPDRGRGDRNTTRTNNGNRNNGGNGEA